MSAKRILIVLSVAAFLATASIGTAGATTAGYIKFDGIDGEVTKEADHKGWIDLVSVSQLGREPQGSTGASRRGGSIDVQEITISKAADKASPKLAEAVCQGRVFPKVEIHVPASGGDATGSSQYSYELRNVRVTSYSVSASGSSGADRPTEQISLNFEEIKVSYARPASSSKGNVETNWKVEKGE